MSKEELLQEQAAMQASMAAWQKKIVEIDKIMDDLYAKRAAAEKQIDVHSGHLERIAMWLGRIDYANADTN